MGGLSHCTEVLEQCPRKGCARPDGIRRHTHTHTHKHVPRENDGNMDGL